MNIFKLFKTKKKKEHVQVKTPEPPKIIETPKRPTKSVVHFKTKADAIKLLPQLSPGTEIYINGIMSGVVK